MRECAVAARRRDLRFNCMAAFDAGNVQHAHHGLRFSAVSGRRQAHQARLRKVATSWRTCACLPCHQLEPATKSSAAGPSVLATAITIHDVGRGGALVPRPGASEASKGILDVTCTRQRTLFLNILCGEIAQDRLHVCQNTLLAKQPRQQLSTSDSIPKRPGGLPGSGRDRHGRQWRQGIAVYPSLSPSLSLSLSLSPTPTFLRFFGVNNPVHKRARIQTKRRPQSKRVLHLLRGLCECVEQLCPAQCPQRIGRLAEFLGKSQEVPNLDHLHTKVDA
jgi:hypothetical protein